MKMGKRSEQDALFKLGALIKVYRCFVIVAITVIKWRRVQDEQWNLYLDSIIVQWTDMFILQSHVKTLNALKYTFIVAI